MNIPQKIFFDKNPVSSIFHKLNIYNISKKKKYWIKLTTVAFGECNSSCFSSNSRFWNEAEHWEHACIPPTLKTDRELSGLMVERPASSPFAVEVNDEDEDDVGRVLCDSDDAISCCVDFWCICCAGDVVLLSDVCEFSICSFNA